MVIAKILLLSVLVQAASTACYVDGRFGQGIAGTACVFPFVYSGVTYNSCTMDGWAEPYSWCATAVNEANQYTQYGSCSESCVCRDKMCRVDGRFGGTTAGTECIFPFVYNNVRYHGCTTAGILGIPWCATTINAIGEFVEYGTCSVNSPCPMVPCRVDGTQGSAKAGTLCKFPFVYQGVRYDVCAVAGMIKGSWCATDVDDNLEYTKYGSCNNTCPTI